MDTDTFNELESKSWWGYLGEDIQKLLGTSEFLYSVVEGWGADLPGGKEKFDDYSFIVFPAAKAYEGFLKKLFLSLGFISEEDYFGKHFRIGRSLNPSLPKKYKRENVYEKLVKYCGGSELADKLWDTWRLCRNLTFHWFPNEKNALTLSEAKNRINMVINAMDEAFIGCKI